MASFLLVVFPELLKTPLLTNDPVAEYKLDLLEDANLKMKTFDKICLGQTSQLIHSVLHNEEQTQFLPYVQSENAVTSVWCYLSAIGTYVGRL